MEVNLIGFDNLDDALKNPKWVTRPLGKLFDTWRFEGQRETVKNFKRGPGGWMDTTHTRRTVTSERDDSEWPTWARFGSNDDRARWGEYGTGLLSEDPKSSHRRHWPPAHALDKWALKHGFASGFIVARIIGTRGGLKPRRMFRDANATITPKLGGWLATMAREIEDAADGVAK